MLMNFDPLIFNLKNTTIKLNHSILVFQYKVIHQYHIKFIYLNLKCFILKEAIYIIKSIFNLTLFFICQFLHFLILVKFIT